MRTNADRELVLMLGQAGHEHLNRLGSYRLGLDEFLAEDVDRA